MSSKVGDKVYVRAQVADVDRRDKVMSYLCGCDSGDEFWVRNDELINSEEVEKYARIYTKHGYDLGYEDGMNKAWEVAKKIIDGYTAYDLYQIFGSSLDKVVINEHTAMEAAFKMERWENEKIQKGDVVTHLGREFVVTYKNSSVVQGINRKNGKVYICKKGSVVKTGRKVPVAKILEESEISEV